ncbi:MAG: Glucose/sorbosone dehydrogenase-like protein [Actinomycetia bacterium]|nr:Glucose/sorbosone dehydrogenase-like protein [Actinomycetes bacterium]
MGDRVISRKKGLSVGKFTWIWAVTTAITSGFMASPVPATADAGTEVRNFAGHKVAADISRAPVSLPLLPSSDINAVNIGARRYVGMVQGSGTTLIRDSSSVGPANRFWHNVSTVMGYPGNVTSVGLSVDTVTVGGPFLIVTVRNVAGRVAQATCTATPNVIWPANCPGFVDITPQPPRVRYEAEDATISQGTVATNHSAYSGKGFVDMANGVAGAYVEWTVNVATAGSTAFTVRYANGTTVSRPMDVSVNGTLAASRAFNGTGSWNTWADAAISANLKAGSNTIRLTATTAKGGPNLDYLELGGSASS